MGKLFINSEGFVDLRKNPPASTTVTVQGFTPPAELPRKLAVEMMPEPPAEPKDEVLPGRQKDTEGLELSIAGPVQVPKNKRTGEVRRIQSVNDPNAYAIVSLNQWRRLGGHQWYSVRSGHLYRKVKNSRGQEEVIWLHRVIKHCNRSDRWVAFKNGDQRDCTSLNLVIVKSKEEAKAIRMRALQSSAGS